MNQNFLVYYDKIIKKIKIYIL